MDQNAKLHNIESTQHYPILQVNAKKQRLVITRLLKEQEGRYACIVTNPLGSLTHSFTVEALDRAVYRPKIVERPMNQTIIVGMDASFK